MNRGTILAVVAAFGIAAAAAAGEPEAKKPEGPKPSPEVEKLGYFLGPWTSEGNVRPGALGEGGPTTGRDICRWMPGKFFVGCMMESKGPMGLMQVQGIMGYDEQKKVYRWWSFNNLGQAETATGTLKDGTWTWSGESKVGDKVMKTRYTISDTKPSGYNFRFDSSADGKTWSLLIAGKVARMAQRPPGATGTPSAPAPEPKNQP